MNNFFVRENEYKRYEVHQITGMGTDWHATFASPARADQFCMLLRREWEEMAKRNDAKVKHNLSGERPPQSLESFSD